MHDWAVVGESLVSGPKSAKNQNKIKKNGRYENKARYYAQSLKEKKERYTNYKSMLARKSVP